MLEQNIDAIICVSIKISLAESLIRHSITLISLFFFLFYLLPASSLYDITDSKHNFYVKNRGDIICLKTTNQDDGSVIVRNHSSSSLFDHISLWHVGIVVLGLRTDTLMTFDAY